MLDKNSVHLSFSERLRQSKRPPQVVTQWITIHNNYYARNPAVAGSPTSPTSLQMDPTHHTSDFYVQIPKITQNVLQRPSKSITRIGRQNFSSELPASASTSPDTLSTNSDQSTDEPKTPCPSHNSRCYTIYAKSTTSTSNGLQRKSVVADDRRMLLETPHPKHETVIISRTCSRLSQSRKKGQQTCSLNILSQDVKKLEIQPLSPSGSGSFQSPTSSIASTPSRFPPSSYREYVSSHRSSNDQQQSKSRRRSVETPTTPTMTTSSPESRPSLRSWRHVDVGTSSVRSLRSNSYVEGGQSIVSKGKTFGPSSSISTAPTPFSSPEVSPLPNIATPVTTRSKPTLFGSGFPSKAFRQHKALPSPTLVYSHKSYYVNCPHSSPPEARPLNEQPKFVRFHPYLIKFPPLELQSFLSSETDTDPPMISVIEGSCPSCDLAARRQAETAILNKYALLLEEKEAELESCYTMNKGTTSISPRFRDKESTETISTLDTQIGRLRSAQDKEIKHVWSGATARWGPGTLGIHREERDEGCRRSSRMTTRSTATSRTKKATNDGVLEEGRMVWDWIRPDLPDTQKLGLE